MPGPTTITGTQFYGTVAVSGSLTLSGSITSTEAVASASYALTASYALNGSSGGNMTGSLFGTASYSINSISASYSTAIVMDVTTVRNAFDKAILYATAGGKLGNNEKFTFADGTFQVGGGLNAIIANLNATGSLSGSLVGSASYASSALSSSFAISSSFAKSGGSPTFPYTGSAVISGSLTVTGPANHRNVNSIIITSNTDTASLIPGYLYLLDDTSSEVNISAATCNAGDEFHFLIVVTPTNGISFADDAATLYGPGNLSANRFVDRAFTHVTLKYFTALEAVVITNFPLIAA